MLKKKNIAMMTAIAAVATSVAPVAAAELETQYVNEDSLLNEVERLLDTKYSNSKENGKGDNTVAVNTAENSVYDIRFELSSGTSGSILTVAQAKKLVEDTKISNETLSIVVVDKGHREEDGKIVATEKNEFAKYQGTLTTSSVVTGATVTGSGIITTAATMKTIDQQDAVKLTLANGDELIVKQDDYVLDMNRPVDKNGNIVDKNTTGALAKTVVGFKNVETGKIVENDMPSKEVAKFQYRENGATLLTMNLSELKDEQGYTQKGADLVNMLVATNNGATSTSVVKDGDKYNIVCRTTADVTEVKANTESGYSFEIQLKADKLAKTSRESLKSDRNVKITINGDSQKELQALRADIIGLTEVEVGSQATYTKLAGDSRFETAIEISKASYDKHDATTTAIANSPTVSTANAVVLVGESAVVDGLAAAPLAKQKNAPILFTKKDVVTEETMNEIKRVVEKGTDIYLVGGEAVISKEVEKQLIEEMNANIIRLAGEDRNETSIKIAEEMTKTATASSVYVVGADGEADAMSIAALASQETTGSVIAPIIVTPANGLTKDAKHFLTVEGTTNATIVGGEAKISTQVMKDLKAVNTVTSVTRLAGETRHETNAKVIETLYRSTPETVYVAKDGYVGGNDKLIDALAVAPLAGKNNAPIVLATDVVTERQKQAVDTATNENLTTNKLVQVGNGIASTVMDSLVKILGLNK